MSLSTAMAMTMKSCSPLEAIHSQAVLVDVRSESEYAESHIPGAINIPILDDFSRKEVGTVYREHGKEAAIAKGLELTSPILGDIYQRFGELPDPMVLYCARGGMRSHSIAHVLTGFGHDVTVIQGGYKAYREQVLRGTSEEIAKRDLIVLQGNTGVSKTTILKELATRGYGVLDLEELAKHSGSVFGHLTFGDDQPSQKQFENNLYHALRTQPKLVFLESESRQIGKLYLPGDLVKAMDQAKHILLDTGLDNRVATIMEMYAPSLSLNKDALIEAINHLRRRLSNQVTDELIQQVRDDQLEPVIRYLMETYYDPLYLRSVKRADYDYILELNFPTKEEAIETIITTIKHLY